MRLGKASLSAGGSTGDGLTLGLQSCSFAQWSLCHPLVIKGGREKMERTSAVRETQEHSPPAEGTAVCFAGVTSDLETQALD